MQIYASPLARDVVLPSIESFGARDVGRDDREEAAVVGTATRDRAAAEPPNGIGSSSVILELDETDAVDMLRAS